jgi:hypothetical protein
LRDTLALRLPVERGISGIEQALCLIVTPIDEFLIGEKYQ